MAPQRALALVKEIREPRGVKKKIFFLTSVGIEPTTSGLDLPLSHRLSYGVGERVEDDIRW